ncbi:anticodon nuclease [Aggregatibacter actinomycetemcomitans serotype e str. SC936]|uniref:AAA family ATPase n=1 Tax=Aggregatibacter actinomycetemcomitans TaxID=714 RepID=UPI00077E8B67|nr:AAA family ATPase [Aggregatibacter actinomycetemcomitans]KYK81456.1 anticodon nuclease [Aggregatibacter actinomycetemcomitans serotype e str. SC936]TYB21823.1 AAA family ATPase [Aggregatibacter actinomycetemcomitans]
MSKTLLELSQFLMNDEARVHLIYAFNGTGKTRLSNEFKKLIQSKYSKTDDRKIIYYNSYTEDMFYWDNESINPKLNIYRNNFLKWINEKLDEDEKEEITSNFQRYINNDKLTPNFGKEFSSVNFYYASGDSLAEESIKISKGEESNFIWSIFYTVIDKIKISIDEGSNNRFKSIEYIFIDDPVSSLDDNYLIELAIDLAKIIKVIQSKVKVIISTHNPLFYNVLHNELRKKDKYKKYYLEKYEDGKYNLTKQDNDHPFSYHIFLKKELQKAISNDSLQKYHFNFLRNLMEKTSTYLGYSGWKELLDAINKKTGNNFKPRLIDLNSHSAHSSEEISNLRNSDKDEVKNLVNAINEFCNFME